MSKLDDAVQEHMAYIVHIEHRPFSYLDFTSDNAKGQPYYMKHGTFRNKILSLKKAGVIELCYRSVHAFYTLPGAKFGKQMTMTSNHMVASSVTGVTSLTDVNCYNKDLTTLPIYREIQKLPPEMRALHDIHYRFHVSDIWKTLGSGYEIDPSNQAVILPPIVTNDLELTITVYPTDTVTVIVGCSNNPVAVATEDVIRLSNGLTRTEERLSRIVDECGYSFVEDYETIHIPDHNTWTVTMWHFGTDSFSYKECAKEKYCCTWQDGQNVLIRAYKKRLMKNRDGNWVNRKEVQEYPQKSHLEALKDKMNQE
jgi:hypothetical protein